MLSAENIFVSYASTSSSICLNGVSVSFVPGQVTAIVGPNGSGKSTLIRALSRVLKPCGGRVLLDDLDIYEELTPRQAAIAIGVVPQETQIAFDFTVREIVAMGRTPHAAIWSAYSGETALDRDAVEQAMVEVQLPPELVERPLNTLSGGERQRVLIARALVQDTPFILLDEPTASLDLAHQERMLRLLKKLAARKNKSVVVVMHDLSMAAGCADRLIVMDRGSIADEGPVPLVLTPDLVRRVYACNVLIVSEPVTGKTIVVTVPDGPPLPSLEGMSFFVIGGGGGSAGILRALALAGANVHAGYLMEGDPDRLIADAYAIKYLPLEAFAIVPELDETTARRIAGGSRVIILSPSRIGPSNANILKSSLVLAQYGAKVCTFAWLAESIQSRSAETDEDLAGLWSDLLSALFTPPFRSVDHCYEYMKGLQNA